MTDPEAVNAGGPEISADTADANIENPAPSEEGGSEDEIDEEQLDEYREMIEQLGHFPDKVKINSLSMVAEDHAESKSNALAIYNCIRIPLLSSEVAASRKLPLVYVIDSILKNVKGAFVPIIEDDARVWLPVVFDALTEEQRLKLKKVYNIWREAGIFGESKWKEMGACFEQQETTVSSEKRAAEEKTKAAGITRAPDGTLKLPSGLRRQMETLLDEAHTGVSELDKVSLERLAEINPDLLVQIKKAAEDIMRSEQNIGSLHSSSASHMGSLDSMFMEIRSPQEIARSKDWEKLNLDYFERTHDRTKKLQHFVLAGSSSDDKYTHTDAINMTTLLATAAATATHLTNSLQRIKDQNEEKENRFDTFAARNSLIFKNESADTQFHAIDKNMFTNEGVKKKNNAVVGLLYEVGLPFVSYSDGRRFGTQLELSNHLDYLFKKNQLEKSMERTEERGWFLSLSKWTLTANVTDSEVRVAVETADKVAAQDEDPSTFTHPADESRDRCVICGINFKMFFDNDEGIFMYSNCREMKVLNDDAAEKESEDMLVHVTCWRGLGSPDFLTMDQALQERKS